MTRAEFLEVEIRKCRWLADVINDDIARAELLKLADEYEGEATQLDGAARVSLNWVLPVE